MKRLVRSSIAISSLGMALLSGCGSGGEGVTVTAASVAESADPDSPCTKTDVAARLAEIRAFKRDHKTAPPEAASTPGVQDVTGDYAYSSLPIDITGPGKYTIKFGPVDEGFDFPNIQKALDFQQAADFTARVEHAGNPEMVTDSDGKRYLRADVEIKDVGPCTSFVMFVA